MTPSQIAEMLKIVDKEFAKDAKTYETCIRSLRKEGAESSEVDLVLAERDGNASAYDNIKCALAELLK